MAGLHPDEKFDRWYGEDERLKFANKCDNFRRGQPLKISVEGNIGVTDKLMSDFNDMLLDMECSGVLDPKYPVLLRVFLEMKRMKNQIKILEGKLENA